MIELTYKNCGSARQKLNGAAGRFRKAEPALCERFFDTANGRVFSTEKIMHYGEGEKRVSVLMAAGPELKSALAKAAELTYEKKCEFRVEAASAHHFVDRVQQVETHFVLIDRPIPRHYVYLETGGERFSDADTAAFGRLFNGIVGEGDITAFCRELTGMLRFIDERMPRKGVPPKLTFRERELWSAGGACDGGQAEELARLIRANGLIGTNFGYFRRLRDELPARFEFHAHPGFLIPPSTGDIVGVSSEVFRNSSELKLCIQAVSVKLAESVYRLSISSYFREEWNGWMDALAVRAGYLHQAYNEGKREITEEAVKLLQHFIRAMPHLTESMEVVERFGQLTAQTKGSPYQKALLAQWNGIVAAIRKAGPVEFASPEWEKSMWELSGGIARI